MKSFINSLKKLINYPLLLIFLILIFSLTLVDLITPQKKFSDMENKFLQMRPKLTYQGFVKGEFVPKYEKYINEQFVLRNRWIDLKSRVEYYIGKTENNGIVYGRDGYLFDKVQAINTSQLEKNTKSIKKFINSYNSTKIKFALIPNSYEVLSEKLPYGIKLYNQEKLINSVNNSLSVYDNVQALNFIDILKQHKTEYIYYKTDHHWTTLGAYYSYVEFMKSVSRPYVDIKDLKANEVECFLGTYYSKAKKFNSELDKIVYYDVNIDKMVFGDNEYKSIYDLEKFNTRDKYAAFLYGNNDLTVISNNTSVDKTEKSRILIIKDSFGNSFVPFLTYSYDEVYVLDLRSNSKKVSEIMKEYRFDDILIMYSVNNFIDDINIIRATY